MIPEIVADYSLAIGECPLWHPEEKKLYWLDIQTGRIFWYQPATGHHEQFYKGKTAGGFTFQEDGALLLFMENGAVMSLKEGMLKSIINDIPELRGTRFNDVIADPEGRVFCGTMPGKDNQARLYCLERDGSIKLLQKGIGLSNGMGFSPDKSKMYHTDSAMRNIYIWDYDRESGEISNREIFVSIPEDEGVPDGLTVDAEGFVWSARWDGGSIVRYTPDGKEDIRVYFPAKKVSSLIFGSEDYREIYITTAGGDDKNNEGKGAGALFRVKTSVRGIPEFKSRVCI